MLNEIYSSKHLKNSGEALSFRCSTYRNVCSQIWDHHATNRLLFSLYSYQEVYDVFDWCVNQIVVIKKH